RRATWRTASTRDHRDVATRGPERAGPHRERPAATRRRPFDVPRRTEPRRTAPSRPAGTVGPRTISGGDEMSDLSHVLVLAGGLSYEREVSLRSGRRVSEVLRATGIDVEARDTDASLVPSILADPPDAVFVTLHGGAGEDGAIRSVLELLNVPYVG